MLKALSIVPSAQRRVEPVPPPPAAVAPQGGISQCAGERCARRRRRLAIGISDRCIANCSWTGSDPPGHNCDLRSGMQGVETDAFERANRMSGTAVRPRLRHRHRHRRHLHGYRLRRWRVRRHAGDQGREHAGQSRHSASCAASRRSSRRRTPRTDDVAGLAHGTTVATNALLQGEIAGLGLIVTAGFRHILEIARQAVPEGYGNSYFWVKPERIVPLRFVREVGGRLDFRGAGAASARRGERRAGRGSSFASSGIHAVGVCLLHSYANPRA